ncbi:alpha/beta fold hydrolase [Nocardia otitidiscaviarum]|uniref:alpha/beta fold hydrolase n=1 Tax=Nocardia otitidiscaviarum TaxID=1823 RepID=UPI003980BB17
MQPGLHERRASSRGARQHECVRTSEHSRWQRWIAGGVEAAAPKSRHGGGIEVFYREVAAVAEPCVLLLHGFPSSSHTFRDVLAPLGEVSRVVAPDLPGFGFSAAPGVDDYEYAFAHLADTVEAFLERKCAPRRAGQPMGHREGLLGRSVGRQPRAATRMVELRGNPIPVPG